PRKNKIDTIRAAEASEISATILAAKRERWSVQRNDQWAPANFNDMAVLVPRRSSLPSLEKAFTKYGIPYRLESANLVWRSREIRDLIMCLRAINDPTDFLATISALRSPIYGCGDDDLYQYRVNGRGSWNFAELPETHADDASDIALKGLRHLASLYRLRTLLSPSELIEKLISDQQLYEQSVISQRPRDSLRRLRYVVDQARAWSDATSGTLHRFLRWASSQADKNSRAVESVLPESDNDSVRVMTIHAAKGLEFPITIVAGLAGASNRSKGLQVGFNSEASSPMIRCKTGVESSGFSHWLKNKNSLEQAERIRLLYVACTRASDHLIISVHRSDRSKRLRGEMNAAELICDGCVSHTDITFTVPPLPAQPLIKKHEKIQTHRPGRKDWEARRTLALSLPNHLRSISPTGIARLARKHPITQSEEGLNKHRQDLSEIPWRKGRYGSALGRAVHGVLQTIDLSAGTNIAALSASQAGAESISHQSELVEAFVTSALETEIIKSAARQRHWRELYVAAPVNGLVLEGYIDLMYQEDDTNELILIDYKTDQITDLTAEDKVSQYRLQGAAYAFAVEATTGQQVKEMKFVFLSSDGEPARVQLVNDLHLAIAEVELLTKRVEGH
ncbi:MAG: PD-(D/E)XK nuclease family protein, partial [Acidimicrobiales bacterium]|nr:PD-(D/E)XK nuclease family protein [Acidimicrobiales bacterium]